MGIRRVVSLAAEGVLVVLVLAFVLGAVLGQPVLLSYVETGSMAPTLQPGDGFVAVPAAVAGPVEVGDVVVFEAEDVRDGGLTTHRVVDETERGYVTRGDANPFTDQGAGASPVQPAQIVAVAWQPGGDVLAVPGVGTVVTATQSTLAFAQRRLAGLFGTRAFLGVQGLAYLLAGLSVGLYAVDVWRARGSRDRSRSRSRDAGTSPRVYALVFAGALVLAATAAMVVPAGTQELGVVSAEFDGPGPGVIEQGTSESTTWTLGNGGFVPVVSVLEPETEGVDVDPRRVTIAGGSTVNATITVSAPPDPGHYRFFLTERRYLSVLPPSVLEALYRIHPWVPIVAVDAFLGLPVYLLTVRVLGRGRIRSRSRDGPSRVRRLLPGGG